MKSTHKLTSSQLCCMYLHRKTAQHDRYAVFHLPNRNTHTHTPAPTYMYTCTDRKRIIECLKKKKSCHEVVNSANCTADHHIKRFTVSTLARVLVLAEGSIIKESKGEGVTKKFSS